MSPRDPVALSGLREASAQDADDIAALINEAYLPAEGFLYDGPRISLQEVRSLLESGGFLLRATAIGSLEGCVYVEVRGDIGYFGLLAVSTERQHHGLGRRLVSAAEAYFRDRGCAAVEIDVVNHRRELFPFYGGMGYHVIGEKPFEDVRLHQPCRFVMMRKTLGSA
ncbi:MAG TPA: GNAT family N-acetyltransferase [Steroidobacteraceae bacterium]|nr:GNAT family N-acetyltransferase [Steroidobacteraceae bacterium]